MRGVPHIPPPQINIGDSCRLGAFSLAGPGLTLQRGEQLPALSTAPRRAAAARGPTAKSGAEQKVSPSWAEASSQRVDSPALAAPQHAALQACPHWARPHLLPQLCLRHVCMSAASAGMAACAATMWALRADICAAQVAGLYLIGLLAACAACLALAALSRLVAALGLRLSFEVSAEMHAVAALTALLSPLFLPLLFLALPVRTPNSA